MIGVALVSGHMVRSYLSEDLLRVNKKAIHNHCHRQLNLVVATSYQKVLDLSIENHLPGCLNKKLENVFHTRWVKQITELHDFGGLFFNCTSSYFYELTASFDFLATLVPTRSILDLTLPVTELLQGEEIDMAEASFLLASLTRAILLKYNNFNGFHNSCYRTIVEVAESLSINEVLNLILLHFEKVDSMFPWN